MKGIIRSAIYHIILAMVILVLGIALHVVAVQSAEPLPRVIITLYDSRSGEQIHLTRAHLLAALPLNHLGLTIEQHDMAAGLPDIAKRRDVRGVLTWFSSGTKVREPEQFIRWAGKVVDSGKKFVILGDLGFMQGDVPLHEANAFLQKIGLKTTGEWISATYDYDFITKDKSMVEFEREYEKVKPAYMPITPVDKTTRSYLVIGKQGDPSTYSHIITIGARGSYVASGYEYYNPDNEYVSSKRQWYIDPFEFFRLAFATDDLPKPDATTLAGRRIYYSHIDGDGWNNVSLIEGYVEKRIPSAQVIMERAIVPYLDLPVTVSPIAAELDPNWLDFPAGREVAKQLFALPNVEVGSHTYSHPFQWEFFADGDIEKERGLLGRYKGRIWDKNQEMRNILSFWDKQGQGGIDVSSVLGEYTTPRAYAAKPFDINLEISGALKTIAHFLPEGKKVEVLQWSGDTEAFEQAIALSHEAGLKNINGGDSRFDTEYPSRMWLSPMGIRVGKQLQIYASNSNENTYTNLWTERFHGFRYLRKTVDNTETPIRLKPFNIYYHTYSGEREASLKAVLSNLDYARTQEIAPVTTSHFAAIGDGFYAAKVTPIGNQIWRIDNRGALTTIRFDRRSFGTVDFARSKGVVGQRHFQGSLYVYMDDAVASPIIALKATEINYAEPPASRPYLIQSRWNIEKLVTTQGQFSFFAKGFGNGDMQWAVPINGRYEVILPDVSSETLWVNDHVLSLKLPMVGMEGIDIKIRYRGNA